MIRAGERPSRTEIVRVGFWNFEAQTLAASRPQGDSIVGRDIVRQNATPETTSNPCQLRAIAALVGGATVTAAAQAAGVSRATVHRWLADDHDFASELALAKIEQAAALKVRLRALGDLAVGAMQDLLTSTNVPPAVRLRTASTVLELLRTLPGLEDLYDGDLRPFAELERRKQRAARVQEWCDIINRHEAERANSDLEEEEEQD
jgi:hypothetical protein